MLQNAVTRSPLIHFIFISVVTRYPADTMASTYAQGGGQMEDKALVRNSSLTMLKEALMSTLVEALDKAQEDAREGGEGRMMEWREEKHGGGESPEESKGGGRVGALEGESGGDRGDGEDEEHSDGGDDDDASGNDVFDEPWERATVMRVISQLTEFSPPPSPVSVSVPIGAGRFESQTSVARRA